MNDSEIKITKSVLRWILFLPSAIICAFIGSLAGKAVYRIPFLDYFLSNDSLFYKVIEFPLSGICCGAGFILFGVLIAPRKKRAVSLFLLILINVISLMVIYAILFTKIEKDYWTVLFSVFLTISSLITYYILEADPMDE